MSRFQVRRLAPALVLAGLSLNLYAVDGIVLIDQNRALSGNVTPGDTPGFPVTISLSGSYRLSGNLTVPNASTDAILVTADNVTIDLNGFSILGPVVCTPTTGPVTACSPFGLGVGVNGSGTAANVTVQNGVIHGMGALAIELGSGTVEKMHVSSNGTGGISIGFGTVTGNFAHSNGGVGISTSFAGNVFSGNTSSLNAVNGIQGSGAFSGNATYFNGNAGIYAFCPSSVVGNGSAINGGGNVVTNGSGCVLANNTP